MPTAVRDTNAVASDLIHYQRELVRTGKTIPLGRMQKIAIGPSADWRPPQNDPYILRFGRMIDLRNRFLPIAQSVDRSMVLIEAPLRNRDGAVHLPDLPDPEWKAGEWTEEEIKNPAKRDIAKDTQRMVAQRLTDRCEQGADGQPAVIEGTNFLFFQPVLRVAFQPQIEGRLVGTAWWIEFQPDLNGRHCTLLIDHRTGESFFLYGIFDISSPAGE